MDYFTLRGIENKLGVKKEDIPTYILHELIDNSLDYIEATLSREYTPEINVYITTRDEAIHLKVSNPDTGQIFTNQIIENMFNYHNYSSTKRNQFKIGRGALGHGLKTVLGAAYALATEHYGYSDWTPLKIRNGTKQWTIGLIVNRKTGLHPPNIKSIVVNDILKTEIEIDIPVDTDSIDKNVSELIQTFNRYLILNPHITMNLTIGVKCNHYPQVQKIKCDWKNLHSIWSYSKKDFEYLISTIKSKNLTLYDVPLSLGLSEAHSLKKRIEFNAPLTEAQHDKSLIHTLYDELKKISDSKDKLELPYDMRVKPRKDAIEKRFEQLGIKVLSIKYQSVNKSYKSEDGEVEFPYVFECAEIKTESHKHQIISGINSSVTKLEYIHNPTKFRYDKGKYYYQVNSISDILRECGYSPDPKEFKKPNSIVFMNLISPRIDYESYAKSHISLKPFSDKFTVGQVVYDTCKGGKRTVRIKGKATQAEIRLNFLTDRYKAVKQNPSLIIDDRWTPSDVWYGCRPELLKNGIVISKDTRSNFTALIRQTCEEEFNCNMEEIGIFAADRAQLYFNRRWYDVGFDELDSLALKGTDLIIIEKEGMAEVLTSLADKYGLALLFTRGFATKYVCDLSELSKNGGCRVSVLSDYDASGILLASKLSVPRIGIDPDTLEYFELEREDVEEEYDPKNHLTGIWNFVSEEEFSYLSSKRIEINSIKTKVGTEAFQKWIIHKIQELFPNRDYNRAIELGEAVLPDKLEDINTNITTKIQSYQKNKRDEIKATLNNIKGFIDVSQYRNKITGQLKKVITDNPNYEDFINKLNELVESYPFFEDED